MVGSSYPAHYETLVELSDGERIIIRPIRPEDAEMEQNFIRELSPESRYFRFMASLNELSHADLAHLTQPDYDREMALIALYGLSKETMIELGVSRYAVNPDNRTAEFAIVVDDKWQGRGLGSALMNHLIRIAKERGLGALNGVVLADNGKMLQLMRRLGFTIKNSPDDPGLKRVEKVLNP